MLLYKLLPWPEPGLSTKPTSKLICAWQWVGLRFASPQVGGPLSPFTGEVLPLGWGQGSPGSLLPAPPGCAEWTGPLCTRPADQGALQLRSIYKPESHLLKLVFLRNLSGCVQGLSVSREAGILNQGLARVSCSSDPTDTGQLPQLLPPPQPAPHAQGLMPEPGPALFLLEGFLGTLVAEREDPAGCLEARKAAYSSV